MSLEQKLAGMKVDAIEWRANDLVTGAKGDLAKMDSALNEITNLLALVGSEYKLENYVKDISKLFGTKKDLLLKKVETKRAMSDDIPAGDLETAQFTLPKGVDANDYLRHGFYALEDGERTGYYFNLGKGSEQQKLSNFVIKPLFHIYSPIAEDNRRMVELYNGYDRKIIEMSSKNMISLEAFTSKAYEEGFYLFEGQKAHLLRLNRAVGNSFPVCFELKTLGWQPEGFFAFSNHLFNGKLLKLDEFGIGEHDGKRYFSPSASLIYSDTRSEDDFYENDRYLRYCSTDLTFETWAELFYKTYEKHGMMGIAAACMAVFRDIVYSVDNSFPLLYAWGEKRSGKSKFMESIQSLFFMGMNAFNCNSGTDFAFFNRMSRYKNCFLFYNEVDPNAGTKEEWLQAFKGSFDGEGRERGKGAKNRTEIQKPNCMLGIAGQYLLTWDDMALISRCLVEHFLENQNRSKQQIDAYDKLLQYQEQGINSVITEILALRANHITKEKYYARFHENFQKFKKAFAARPGFKWEDRIGKNYNHAYTVLEMVSDTIKMPFEMQEFFDHCMERMRDLITLMHNSDILSEFWKIVSMMGQKGIIAEGLHFQIVAQNEVKYTLKGKDMHEVFEAPRRLLYLQFSSVHPEYMKEHKSIHNKGGMNDNSILNYFISRPYFIGQKPNWRWSGIDPKSNVKRSYTNSGYIFNYDLLEREGVTLDFTDPNLLTAVPGAASNANDRIERDKPDEDLPF